MTQQELYDLAKELDTRDVVYLAAAHLEHLRNMEFGGDINCEDRTFHVHVYCKMKPKIIELEEGYKWGLKD